MVLCPALGIAEDIAWAVVTEYSETASVVGTAKERSMMQCGSLGRSLGGTES